MSAEMPSYRKRPQYKGPLTIAQVVEGINLAADNAVSLLSDAKLLYAAGRYTTAIALGILAIEESGKFGVLRKILCAGSDSKKLKVAWRDYRSHTSKNILWLAPHMIASGKATRLIDFTALAMPDSKHAEVLDELKQNMFYTDCLDNAEWSSPGSHADAKKGAEMVFKSADVLARHKRISEMEIQLWFEYVGSLKGHSMAELLEASEQFERRLVDEGLQETVNPSFFVDAPSAPR